MINYVQSIVSPQASSVSTKSATLSTVVTQGNIIPIIGSYNTLSSVVSVSDSLGNLYTINEPVSDTIGGSYWFAYAIAKSTGTLTVTITYSVAVNSSSFTLMEFSNSFDWINPPAPDGFSFKTGTGVTLSSNSFTTTNADDLIIALSNATTGSSITIGSPWTLVAQQSPIRAVWWMASTSVVLVPTLSATQTISGNWAVEIWSLQANGFSPTSLHIITSSVNPTSFIEVYPNRIKEDIYDSLEGQAQFSYVQYGPSLLNG